MRRRNFLKLLGLSGGMAALSGAVADTARAAAGARVEPNPKAVGVLHDSTLCIGCRRCEEACATVNKRPKPSTPYSDLSVLDKKRRPGVDSFTVVNKYAAVPGAKPVFRKQQCNHCLEPACASACFVKALTKTPDGPVTYEPGLCVGCRYCMVACPYLVPAYDYHSVLNPLVYKCTLCAPRLREGSQPGCVESCPTGALLFGRRTELLRLARQRLLSEPGRYVDHIYGEQEMGGASWLYLSPVPHKNLGQPELGTAPAPELTSGALASVPMIAGFWPVLLTGAWAISRRKDKVAAEEQEAALARALAEAGEKADKALEAALARAARDKESALARLAGEHEKMLAEEIAKARAEAAAGPPKKAAAKGAGTTRKKPVAKEKKAGEEA